MTTATHPAATHPWPTLSVADLTAHPGNATGDPDAHLTEQIAAEGITDPLYVVHTSTGALQIVDGIRRLAAAIAIGLTEVPVTHRPLIRVEALTAHPANVRRDLRVTPAFTASVQSEGIRVPLKITSHDGAVRVIDGHRRLAAAIAADLTHVPYEWDERDDAGQYLDMVTTARHREALAIDEEAVALFAASEAGASLSRIAKAAGIRQKDAKAAVRAGRSTAAREAAAHAPDRAWTFEELAALAEFEDDPEAMSRITETLTGYRANADSLRHAIQRERTSRQKRAAAHAHRAELEAAGQRIRDREELPEKAAPVAGLTTLTGQQITAEDHAACPGHVWILSTDTGDRYEPWCRNTCLYEHITPLTRRREADKTAREENLHPTPAVKKANVEWDAAEVVRREWLAEFVKRRTLPKAASAQLTQTVTRALVNGSDILNELAKARTTDILVQLIGMNTDRAAIHRWDFADHIAQDPRRAVQQQFAAVAACHESTMRRDIWRTDRLTTPYERRRAGAWLTLLESLGYAPSLIERAVIDGEPYTPGACAATDSDAALDATD
jgi:ParB family chromosome partitioning protein